MLRPILFSILTALLVVTSVATGVARGASDPADAIVVCRGHGVAVVYVDSAGNEVEGWGLCPETVGTLLASVAVPAWDAVPVSGQLLEIEPSVTGLPALWSLEQDCLLYTSDAADD